MSDITNIFGGSFVPPEQNNEPTDPPEVQVREAMEYAGLDAPDQIIMDGKIHRFNTGGKKDKSGWYVIYGDGIPAGRIGDWREGIEVSFKADVGRKLTSAEEMAHSRRMAEAKKARDEERAKKAESASETVSQIWQNAGAASADHPYLLRKGIQPHGARVTGDGRLIVPLYSDDGEIASVQYIDADGNKKYHPGGATGGKFWHIGADDEPGPVYIAEGFATAATIHETTHRPCYIAYSASNLVPTTEFVRSRHSDAVIVADHDEQGIGQRYAEQAAAKHGARVVVPPIPGDANDYVQEGHDLAQLLQPKADDWLIQADAFAEKPAPLSWRIKHWIQDQAMIMVHGPSGSGKTFVVLDMMLRIASSKTEWMGNRVSSGTVIYLAGEGHHGLRGRVAAWKHRHTATDTNSAKSLNMWLSRDGCDLNTAQGYQRVSESIRGLSESPSVIVVDTLHRFLQGDENSAQDTKTMLDACNGLMRDFECSVILVHHTGNSEEAQHRARGSSAWKGALDTEISVVPPKNDGKTISIVTRKAKDYEVPEPIYGELESVTIPGWFDEDGEAVTSAVLAESEPPVDEKKESAVARHKKTFEQAWWHSGCEEREGCPYVSRSGMVDFLRTNLGINEKSVRQYVKPSCDGKPIADLLNGEVIQNYEHGWIMVDEQYKSMILMRKNG